MSKRYRLDEVWALIEEEVGIQYPDIQNRNKSGVLHRWIGEKHMHETGRNVGAGVRIDYTEKDIRRAIATIRLQRLVGTVTGKVGTSTTRRIREIASYYRSGWAVAFLDMEGAEAVIEAADVTEVAQMLTNGAAVIALPCYVAVLDHE